MRAIICAAGSGQRWSNYLGRRKHLVEVDGERLVDRIVRLLRTRGITDIWMTCHPDHPYQVEGVNVITPSPEPSNAKARLATMPYWHPTERTLVILGDVYLSAKAADIMTADYQGWVHFARLSVSHTTGKPGAEMFGCSFGPEDQHEYSEALHRAGPGSDWPAYCSFVGKPVDTEPNDIRDWGHHVDIPDDGTDDFDFPDDYERFMFTFLKRSARRVIASDFDQPWFQERKHELNAAFKYHRKLWEHASIAQAYKDRLNRGGRAIGFGVGKEALPAWFAAQGAQVLATDRPEAGVWNEAQRIDSIMSLRREGICDEETFISRVQYAPVDMRAIHADLRQGEFDLTWSTSYFEHLGGIKAGLDFFCQQMECLKPGGLALHTTEYNILSNDQTIDGKDLCVFRQKDLLELTHRLAAQGDRLWPIELRQGMHPFDLHVDTQPFKIEPHLNIRLGDCSFTSVLLIAMRGNRE